MPRIMVSYRRADSAGIAGRIFDRLGAHFGPDSVFMDVDAIPLGVDYRKYIENALATMDFLLVVIGPRWLGERPGGLPRIGDADDPVRIELEMGLKSGVRLIPVLVDAAEMPPRDALPDSLKDFPFVNAAVVASGVDFQMHVDRLIRFIEGTPHTHDAAATFAPPRESGNLPIPLTALIGREREVAAVKALLLESRLVTLTGSGGVGKTRVALQVAKDLQSAYVDGAWFVDLAPLRSPELVANEIASTLSIQQTPDHPVLDSITAYLRERDALLVVDNCEHLVPEVSSVVEAILKKCPVVRVLATSREQLGIEGERAYRVPPLSMPESGEELTSVQAAEFAAVSLFTERATSVNPDFALTDRNASLVADICRRLDGIALAIELAAARTDVLSVRDIRDRLAERFRVLTAGQRTAVPRQQTMRAAIDWSYDLLSRVERTLLNRLAVFAGGCTLEAAETICGFADSEKADILEGLSSLVRKSLVIADFGDGGTRYRMLESTRAYAAEKAQSEWAALSKRHAEWIEALTASALQRGSHLPQQAWLESLECELDNIRLALSWSLAEEKDANLAACVLADLAYFWYDAGIPVEGQKWIDAALARVDEHDDPLIAGRLWRSVAINGIGRSSVEAAQKAIDLFEARGDQRELATANNALAFGLFQVSRIEEADVASRRAVQLYEACGLQGTRQYADMLAIRAMILRALGSDAEARQLFSASVAIFVEIGDERGAASVKGNLAELEFANGNAREALQLAIEAGEAFHRLGAATREAAALVNAASYRLELREVEEARQAALSALEIARRTKDAPIIAVAIQNLAAVKALRGEAEQAARFLGFVDEWYRREGYEREWGERRVSELLIATLESHLSHDELAKSLAAGALLNQDDLVRTLSTASADSTRSS